MKEELPDILYHYTNINGVRGILSSRKFHLTHFAYLNDGEEFSYLFNKLDDFFREKFPEDQIPPNYDFNKENFFSTLKDDRLYVGSFSSLANSLSQWRAYGSYAIGFKTSELIKICEAQSFSLESCEYDKDRVETTLSHFWEKSIQSVLQSEVLSNQSMARVYDLAHGGLLRTLEIFALRFKHPSFEEEKEYRVLPPFANNEAATVQFREKSNLLIPFRELDLGDKLETVVEKYK